MRVCVGGEGLVGVDQSREGVKEGGEMIDSPGSERQKILSFFFPSLPLFCFHLLFSAYPGPCRAQR